MIGDATSHLYHNITPAGKLFLKAPLKGIVINTMFRGLNTTVFPIINAGISSKGFV
jgi:uncharacterized membrane protein